MQKSLVSQKNRNKLDRIAYTSAELTTDSRQLYGRKTSIKAFVYCVPRLLIQLVIANNHSSVSMSINIADSHPSGSSPFCVTLTLRRSFSQSSALFPQCYKGSWQNSSSTVYSFNTSQETCNKFTYDSISVILGASLS